MAYREKVLRKKVEKLELKGLQNNKVIPEHLSGLEKLLHDVFLTRRPKPSDYNNRRDLVRVFNAIAKELYGNCGNFPAVKEFGSFLMDLFSSKSDLDLSVNFSSDAAEFSRDKKIKTLRKFAKKFYALQRKGHVFGVQPIMTARVPILKVVDTGTGIECDISVENRDGILKSQIVQIISSIDERFQKLCFLMKAWAKAHDINSSKDRTLNSLSIILLVTFHLQTRDPPILPPFSALFKDGTDPASVLKLVNNFLNYGKGNKESLAKLFVTLLIKLSSVSTLWSKGLCASTYQGAWISKTWDSKVGCISIEDFTDRSQNVARAVGAAQVQKINQCIQHSIRYLFDFMNDSIQKPKLRGFLFGPDATIPPLVDTGTTNYEEKSELPLILAPRVQPGWRGTQHAMSYNHTSKQAPTVRSGEKRRERTTSEGLGDTQQVMLSDATFTKKMRATEGWGGMPSESWRATSNGSWGGTTTGHGGETHHPVTLDPMRIGYMLPTVGWQCRLGMGGMQPAISAGPIWGGTQQASLISSIGNQVSRASLKHHYTLSENPVCETSSGSLLQPNFVSQHRALGFDQLRSINEVVPAPYIKQNPRHGPPYNPYGTQSTIEGKEAEEGLKGTFRVFIKDIELETEDETNNKASDSEEESDSFEEE